jgi:aconitate hydratase
MTHGNSGDAGLHNDWNTLRTFKSGASTLHYYSLPALEEAGVGPVSSLPLSIRIVLESLVRNMDGRTVKEDDVRALANWNATSPANVEVPFKVARVLMQDFTGVPAVVDLAAMREAVRKLGRDPEIIQPQAPVDLVIDHSVQVDSYGTVESFALNSEMEFERNHERYSFLKWAAKTFRNFSVMPPSLGIVHQVNLEYLATCVTVKAVNGSKLAFPDTLVGTDSHTTMVNGIGVLGFGVGGIEAEAAMLNQPVTLAQPEVVGVRIVNKLQEGVTATDLVLTLTQTLRKYNVVGKFVEFYGPGIANLSVPDRATLTNMCPEYGATVALFPIDGETLEYLKSTTRSDEQVAIVKKYCELQGFSSIDYSLVKYSSQIELDLSKVRPSVAGPKLPQSRVDLSEISENFRNAFISGGGAEIGTMSSEGSSNVLKESLNGIKTVEMEFPPGVRTTVSDGDVVIAAITSCTNTSNPDVMVAAGLLAKKAVEKGLRVEKKVKTSFAPGSRVVTDYLQKAGLMVPLEKLGFYLVGYGCTTCIGNSGPLPESVSRAITENKLAVASVLSGNRNFEARIHGDIKANYLMSPPLVVAFAIAGSVLTDMTSVPLSRGDGEKVYLRDIWPTKEEIRKALSSALTPEMYRQRYSAIDTANNEWNSLPAPGGQFYAWDENSTYIQLPPFFASVGQAEGHSVRSIRDARVLALFGDAVTTDHISPAGAFSPDTPAGKYLISKGVSPADFNTYGSRRGNDRVMARGTFANRRIKNFLVPGVEGGFTIHFPDGEQMTIFDAATKYGMEGVPLIVIAGVEYGSGSSRDWAAKGPKLLGVSAVVAKSFERIHRSNLIGMGILPFQFRPGEDAKSLDIDVTGTVTIELPERLTPRSKAKLLYTKMETRTEASAELDIRLDTEMEVEYYSHGGILHYVLSRLLN